MGKFSEIAMSEPRPEDDREEHECEFSGEVDCDICRECGEHSGFCEDCGLSECCGAKPYELD